MGVRGYLMSTKASSLIYGATHQALLGIFDRGYSPQPDYDGLEMKIFVARAFNLEYVPPELTPKRIADGASGVAAWWPRFGTIDRDWSSLTHRPRPGTDVVRILPCQVTKVLT